MDVPFDPPRPEAVAISTTADGAAFLVTVSGPLDVGATPQFRAAMRRATVSGASEVIVDLGGLTLIDSAGMRCLLELDERLERRHRRLLLLPGPPHVQYARQVCGLLKILTFTES